MNEQAKAIRREYKRKWYAANKDKAKASQERYWNKLAAAAQTQETHETTGEPEEQEV